MNHTERRAFRWPALLTADGRGIASFYLNSI